MSEGFFSTPPSPHPEPTGAPAGPDKPGPTAGSSAAPPPPAEPPLVEPAPAEPAAPPEPPAPPAAATQPATPPSTPPVPSLAGLTPEDPSRAKQRKAKRTLLWLTLGILIFAAVGVFLAVRFWPRPTPPANSANQPVAVSSNQPRSNDSGLPVDPTQPVANFANPNPGASPSANSSGWPAITSAWVMNRIYPTPPPIYNREVFVKDRPVAQFELKNGLAQFELGNYVNKETEQRVKVKVIAFLRPESLGTGDIDGDGVADALVIIKWSENDGPSLPQLYTIKATKPYGPIWSADPVMGKLGALNWSATGITLSRGRAELKVTYQKPEDQACCWTGDTVVNLQFTGDSWVAE